MLKRFTLLYFYAGILISIFAVNCLGYNKMVVKKTLEKSGMWCVEKYSIGDYLIEREYPNEEFKGNFTFDKEHFYSIRVEIFKDAKSVLRKAEMNAHYFMDGESIELIPPYGNVPLAGEDINNDGIPELVICEWTGGAHCCAVYTICSLDKEFRVIDKLNSYDSAFKFKDIDNDGAQEILGCDWTFAGLWTSFADGPHPGIILKYNGKNYVMAIDLMRQKSNGENLIDLYKKRYGKELKYYSRKLQYALEMIYTGNGDKGIAYLYKDIDAELPAASVSGFKSLLKNSSYWEYIYELNDWKKE